MGTNVLRGWRGGVVALAVAFTAGNVPSTTDAATVDELEARLRQMQEDFQRQQQQMQRDMRALRAEIDRLGAVEEKLEAVEARTDEPIQQMEQRIAKVETGTKRKGNMVIFRGGYVESMDSRSGEIFIDTNLQALNQTALPGLLPKHGTDNGYYVSAGLDFLLSDDLLGLADNTWLSAELTVEFKNFGSSNSVLITPSAECFAAVGTPNAGVPAADLANCLVKGKNQVTMLSISAAPKIRFLEGSRLRPWIIPAGFDVNVISPPSDAATVLEMGAVFGAGADYEFMPGWFIGVDARYHLLPDFTSTGNDFAQVTSANLGGLPIPLNTDRNRDYWTVGAYIGIGF